MHHELKIKKIYAERILNEEKLFEVRVNDRDYQTGDTISFKVISPSGNEDDSLKLSIYVITYILNGPLYGIAEGYCVFGIKPCSLNRHLKEIHNRTKNKDYDSFIKRLRNS